MLACWHSQYTLVYCGHVELRLYNLTPSRRKIRLQPPPKMSAFTSLRRDFDVEHQLYEVGRRRAVASTRSCPRTRASQPAMRRLPRHPRPPRPLPRQPPPPRRRKGEGTGRAGGPLSDPLTGRSSAEVTLTPSASWAAAGRPALNTPSPGAAGAQDESEAHLLRLILCKCSRRGKDGMAKRWKDFTDDVLLHYNIAGKFRVKANFMTDVDDKEQPGGKNSRLTRQKRAWKNWRRRRSKRRQCRGHPEGVCARMRPPHELTDCWKQQSVQSLKIAIQCAASTGHLRHLLLPICLRHAD